MPCVNICNAAPLTPIDAPALNPPADAATPSITNPMWETEEYAISRLRSVCRNVTMAP